jgi:hypothetical protein
MTAVSEHRDRVRQLLDLVHPVRDVEERQTVFAQSMQDAVDALDIGCRQRRRRLVEDQELGVAAQRLGDLHHLAARQRQVADKLDGVDVLASDPGEELFGAAALAASG